MNNFSKIGLGALHFGTYSNTKESIYILEKAFDYGINWIDTSPIYGNHNSEKIIGKSTIKNKLKIATKFGLESFYENNTFNVKIPKMSSSYIEESLKKSLKNLNVDYVDLYQLHTIDPTTPISDILDTLTKLVNKGFIKNIGVLNLTPEQLNEILGFQQNGNFIQIKSLQVQYNFLERRFEKDLLQTAKEQNLFTIANRVIGSGTLSGKYVELNKYPKYSRAKDSKRIQDKLNIDILNILKKISLEEKFQNFKIEQIAILWALQSTYINSAIIGIRNNEQLNSLLELIDIDNKYIIFNEINKLVSKLYPFDVFKKPLKYME